MKKQFPSYASTGHRMEQTMRWYGPKDVVSLMDIRQAGCTGVVTALHYIPVGQVWTISEIKKRIKIVKEQGLKWEVVESLPVSETIKTRSKGFEKEVKNYKRSIRNLAKCGIKVITYNFMPVLDWTRTDIDYEIEDGSKALRFEMAAYVAFDLYVLKRKDAEKEYPADLIARAKKRFKGMSRGEKATLKRNILAGLPGSDENFTLRQFKAGMKRYEHIDRNTLQQHLILFLKEIIPIAEEHGIKMAIHPDDPPFSVLGLPRVMSTAGDVKKMIGAVPSINNGLCFCTGSFGAIQKNNLPEMIKQFADRVHFIHLRSTRRNAFGDFYEANHLEGDVDMYAVIKELVKAMKLQGNGIPVRPDHGHQMLDDLNKKASPGYTAIGRLRGLAEIRGLELGVLRGMK